MANASLQIGELFVEEAALLILTETPLLEWFFKRQMAEVRIIINAIAVTDPIKGHLNFSQSEVDAGNKSVSELISLLKKLLN